MKKRSIWLVIGLLIASAVFAFAGCRKKTETTYKLSETEIVLTVGQEKELTISPAPAKSVGWESDDASVATVTNGVVTAIAEGTAVVTATVEGVKDPLTCTVTVEKKQEIVGGGYYLDFASVALKTGETKQLTVLDKEGQPAQSVVYSSADTAVASVSESGLITAVATGETTIKAVVAGEELSCKVTVAQKYTYSLDKTSLDLAAGAIGKLTLITTPEVGESVRPHTFSSSDKNVATVDGGSGKVTAVGKGTATITCLVDGEELTATVTVTEYTVKIGGEAFGAETTLRVGAEEDITVTADPDRAFSAAFLSGDDSVLTVDQNGHVIPKKTGTTTITVTVGGREFKTAATVRSEVLYEISHEEATLNLGATNNTVRLEVTRDPAGDFEAEFESSDTAVATVDESGLVTAAGLGTATITTTVKGTNISFTTEISVVLASSLAHEDYTFGSGAVNLTRLDANKTIDWRQYHTSENFPAPARMKNNANLIGNYNMVGCDDEGFWDYKAPIFVEDADGANSFGVYTYGRAVHGSYTVPVKVTNAVSKIVIFTGSWKESATIEFKIGNAVLQSETFVGGNDALARKYELTLDTSALKEGESLDLTISVNCPRTNGGNVSLVSVAVIGKEAHDTTAQASAAAQVTTGITGEQNLTAAGGLDWVSANGARKAGVPENSVVNANGIVYGPKEDGNSPAGDWKATLTWTDGTQAAPANLKTFRYASDSVSFPVRLDKGKTTVTIFATGFNSGYLAAVYDKNGTFVNAYQGADEKGGDSVASKIAITVDAAEAGEYTVKIMKCRGAGNVGWAAIAVSGANDFEPEQTLFDMNKGGEANITLAGEGTTPTATFVSDNAEIASVDTNGKITAVAAGKTFITVSYAGVERRVFVTVTEYVIASNTKVNLFLGAKSLIHVTSNPEGHAIDATYHLADGEDKISVSASGEITALKAGTAVVTVKVGGVEIGTVTVTIANYELNATSHVIVTASGTNTFKLEVRDPSNNSTIDPANVAFKSLNVEIVTVAADGTITAVGVGKTTVTATYDGVVLECEIEACVLPVTTDEIEYENGKDYTVNLSKLDDTKETLDWHYFGNGFSDEMKDGSQIGELTGERAAYFFDYRAKINYSNGTVREANFNDLTGGWTFKGSISFTVNLTDKTEYIAIFTGAYHAKNTIEVKIGGKVHAVYEFSNRGHNDSVDKNKQIRIYPDVTDMATPQTATITLTCGAEPDNGWTDNISLVAIAVVGKDARTDKTSGTATAEATLLANASEKEINLTEVGTLDWVYAKNGNGGDVTKKAGVPENSIIKYNAYKTIGGEGRNDYYADDIRFKWTDGMQAVAGDSVNNFIWANVKYYIPVHLPKGENEVTLYLSGWKCSYFVTVLDGYGNKLIDAQKVVEGNGSSSQAVAVKVTVTATEASTFTFIMTKEGDGNHGWAAIAVAQKSEYSLAKSTFDATLGGNAAGKIEVLKNGAANTDDVLFVSNNPTVATVGQDGTIAAVGAGTAVITVTVGGTEFFVFVTVTEYTLESLQDVTLPLAATSQIELTANPAAAIRASYASSNDAIATVSESGLITAVAAGDATITVTIDGKTFEVQVHVVEYKLSDAKIELQLGAQGGGTKQLSMLDGAGAPVSGVVFESSDTAIATVDTDGTITAVGIGKTTVKATYETLRIVLECEVECVISVTEDTIDYADGTNNTVNLTTLDDTNVTLDWRYFGRDDFTDRMNGGSLIGEVSGNRQGTFYDYRVKMNWSNGTAKETSYANLTNGWTFKSITFTVTLTKDVKYISIFTGAWHAKNTVEVKCGDKVYATYEFSNRGNNDSVDKNKQVRFYPEVTDLKTPQTVTVTLTCGAEPDNGWTDNISLVAIAVVGNETRPVTSGVSASVTKVTPLADVEGEVVNLSEIGTLDWAYAKNGNDGSLTKKAGVPENSVIKTNEIHCVGGNGYDFISGKHFSWTEGDGTASLAGDKVNNFQWINEKYYIPIHLPKGTSEVTLYLSGWKCSYFLTLLDCYEGKVIDAHQLVTGDGNNSQAVEVKITVTVEEESTVTFLMTKEGDGNHGWAAVAVAALPETAKQD